MSGSSFTDISYNGNRIRRIETSNPRLVTEGQPSAAESSAEVEYDAAGRVIADASQGITSIEYNSDSHPTKIQFKEGHYQELTWDNLGNHISTRYYTNNVASLIQPKSFSIGNMDDLGGKKKPYTESVRRYYGSGQIAVDDSLVMTRFPGGYLTGDGKARYYFNDYQGNNLATVDADGKIVESTGYYPYGLPWDEPTENPYLYGDKEYDNVHGLGEYYYGARQSVPVLAGGFTTIDPLCEKRQWESPYILCGANPIRNVDNDGEAWRAVYTHEGYAVEYEWVDPKDSYDENGKLLEGYYEQAIMFDRSAGKEFDPNNNYNMGSTVATVYKADGTTEEFDACTLPSDQTKYATVPEGKYEAKAGQHNGSQKSYPALRLSDVGTTNFNANRIDLGKPNPSNPRTNYAYGINIHKPGVDNLTKNTRNGSPISKGCFLIDIKRWNEFIDIFTTSQQINNKIGIIVVQ